MENSTNSTNITTYESKPKEFKWLAFFLLVATIAWVSTMLDFSNLFENWIQPASLLVFGLAVFYFFWNYGNKNRQLLLHPDKIEYRNPKLMFSAAYKDVILIKTFQDMNRSRENLIVMTEDDTLSISTAFFEKEKLVACFRQLLEIAKEHDNIAVEDDRLWASDTPKTQLED